MRGTLLIAMLGLGCSEYGLEAGPGVVTPGFVDPAVRPGGRLPDAEIDPLGGFGELGPDGADDEGPNGVLDGSGETDVPFFLDITVDGDGEGSGGPTTGEDGSGGPNTGDDGAGGPTTGEDGAGEDGAGEDGSGGPGTGEDGTGGGSDGWGVDTPPDDPPADEYPDDACDVLDLVTFSSPEIWVGANGNAPTVATGVLVAPDSGWFDVYSLPIQESGDGQRNESAFFRVENATRPDGLPAFGNCGDAYVVVDADNSGPAPGARVYIGTFWLDAGDNTLVMTHYCEIWTTCPALHDDTPGHTCDSGNINSVHFLGDGLCVEDA